MWFNLLKLDLSGLKQNLKPLDIEPQSIKVNNTERCKKKLINFLDKIKKINGMGKHRLQLITEQEACPIVEEIDKMFNTLSSPKLDKRGYPTLHHSYNEEKNMNGRSAIFFYYIDKGFFRLFIELLDKDSLDRLYYVSFIIDGTTEQIIEKITEIEKMWEES